ncbi:hypothetical protein IT414_00650 [bacterium]|nr:hypothetical protein [bacterium]
MKQASRWRRFTQSRWYPVFWLFIFLVVVCSVAGIYYWRYVLGYGQPIVSTTATPSPTQFDKYRLKVSVDKNRFVASDSPERGVDLRLTLVQSDGKIYSPDAEVIVTLSTNNPSGQFSTGSSATISRGVGAVNVRYFATKAGVDTLSLYISNQTPLSTTITVDPAPAAMLSPVQIMGQEGGSIVRPDQDVTFETKLTDIYGNAVSDGKIQWRQVGTSNLREVTTNSEGKGYFVAHFVNQGASYTAIVEAQFGGKKQSLYLTVQP